MTRAAIAIVVALAATVRADDLAKAKQLYDRGLRHFDAGEYAAAITAWTDSYALSKAPLLLFNLGQAYRLSGDCPRAMTYYDDYVRAQPTPKNRDELDQAIALCKDKLATKPQPVPVVEKYTVPAPIAPAHHARRTRPYAYIAGAVGGASGIAAIAFALDGRRLAQREQSTTSWTAANNKDQSRGQLDNTLAYTFGAFAIASIGAGFALYLLDRGDERAVAIVPTRGGAAASVAFRF